LSEDLDSIQPAEPVSPGPSQQPALLDDSALNAEELAEAKQYGRLNLACTLADKAIDLAYLAVVALLLARPIDAWLQRASLLADFWTLRLVALLLVVMGLHVAVSFPLSCYSGYVLEHRFKLSKLRFSGWLWRYTKGLALAIVFTVLMFVGLFWIIRLAGPAWWLVGAAAFFAVSVVLGQLAPVLILPLFYKVQRLDRPDLAERIARLAEGTGLSIEGVYRLDLSTETVKANAALAGLGRTRRVLIGDTLLAGFSPDEIEVVFAHEIGHQVFHHIRRMLLAGIFYSAAGFWVCDRLLAAWVTRWEGRMDYAELPVWTAPMVTLVLMALAMLMEPMQNAVSRRYERQSDRYALERTGMAAAFVSAFRKLARLNKDDPDPHPLEVLLFHSHPPIAQRVRMAEAWEKQRS
jgi:STE24 endopeptidase